MRSVSGSRAAHQLVHELDQLLRAEHLVRVQAAVDPDNRLALGGERARLLIVEIFGQREAPGDVAVVVEVRRSSPAR